MRFGILLLFVLAMLFGSGYWYQAIDPICKTPVYYRIGNVDDRFGTSKEELKRIVKEAELIWEDRVGKDLFIYADDGRLPINLVFDERQETANFEEELREDLEAKEGMSDSVARQYEKLILEFRNYKKDYEVSVVAYETRLGEYNTTVIEWNKKGGAPQEEIEILEEEKEELANEQKILETHANELNSIVSKLNIIGARGNSIITDYNDIVEEYNTEFSTAHEYTQGDHSIEAINVYQFNTEEELILVLAHEFGHALSIGHVPNEESIMYRNMGGQKIVLGLSFEDLLEFNKVCSEKSTTQTIIEFIQNAL